MKKYKTIIVDPPWKYGSWGKANPKSRPNCKTYPMPYPTMTIDEIKKLPIKKIADTNCELYLWATQKYGSSVLSVLRDCILISQSVVGAAPCGRPFPCTATSTPAGKGRHGGLPLQTGCGFNAASELKGKILGCWCAPKACHGDILEELCKTYNKPMNPTSD